MPHAYRELWGADWRSDHAFVQVPDGPGPHPVLVFAHGSAGNFKGYQVVLGALRERGWAVVSPSFGFGNWWRAGGTETLKRALAFVDADPRLDGERVALAALSNGGFAITRSGPALADRFAGVAWLSGVIEVGRLDALAEAYRDRPTWLQHGVDDRRIPVRYADLAEERLRREGARVRIGRVEGEDHFLLFSDRDRSIEFLDAFLRACFDEE
jgi:pimeloyl-ACP methyl ester carboxylesterase